MLTQFVKKLSPLIRSDAVVATPAVPVRANIHKEPALRHSPLTPPRLTPYR
jgi:hypothetical protein